MPFAEATIRGAAAALLLLLIALSLRRAGRSPAARYGALFAGCGIAYLIDSAPIAAAWRYPWVVPAQLLSITGAAVFQLWAAANFDDEFVPSWRRWLPWFGLLALAAAAVAVERRAVWMAVQAVQLCLVGWGLWQVRAGSAVDLVEARRRLRLGLTIAVALAIVALTIIGFVLQGRPGVAINTSIAAVLAALAFSFVMLRLPEPLEAASVATPEAPHPAAPLARQPQPADREEAAALAHLARVMDVEKAYREEGLGIAALASRLAIPEYRLRVLINRRLGHRNFTSFVNGYRLAEAMAALADPEQARVPVLTIALDAGFQSIGPFNRAFKAQTGMTPSEFRRDRLAASPPNAAA